MRSVTLGQMRKRVTAMTGEAENYSKKPSHLVDSTL